MGPTSQGVPINTPRASTRGCPGGYLPNHSPS